MRREIVTNCIYGETMKTYFCAFILANLIIGDRCKNADSFKNYYLIAMTKRGEIDKYIRYNGVTAKESTVRFPSDE